MIFVMRRRAAHRLLTFRLKRWRRLTGIHCVVLQTKAASCSRTRSKQWLHVLAARHLRIRRLEALAQFPFQDELARESKGILQIFGFPQRDVEKRVAEIGPLGLVPAAERRMVGI